MGRVFELMDGAKQAILFLAFDPGNNSILNEAGKMLKQHPDLFVRGALTSPQRATQFSESLHAGGGADAPDDEDGASHAPAGEVTVVGESGKPKKKGDPGGVDFRAVPAGAVSSHDAFGAWEAELAKFGFAIIHNKIVVIDPFSDNCVVVTGSHNLGFRASHNNDENMVIVRGHRGLAEAYACHVLDLYDHYAWRFLLNKNPDVFGHPLEPDDKWQERYIEGPNVKSPELRFWLAAAGGAVASASPKPPAKPKDTSKDKPNAQPAASGAAKPAPADAAPAKNKPAKKAKPARKAAKKPAKTAPKQAAKAKKAAKKTSKKAAKKAPKKKVAKKGSKKASKAASKKKAAKKKAGKARRR
jgi:hypothetical protein